MPRLVAVDTEALRLPRTKSLLHQCTVIAHFMLESINACSLTRWTVQQLVTPGTPKLIFTMKAHHHFTIMKFSASHVNYKFKSPRAGGAERTTRLQLASVQSEHSSDHTRVKPTWGARKRKTYSYTLSWRKNIPMLCAKIYKGDFKRKAPSQPLEHCSLFTSPKKCGHQALFQSPHQGKKYYTAMGVFKTSKNLQNGYEI